jgi:hypothetical protein
MTGPGSVHQPEDFGMLAGTTLVPAWLEFNDTGGYPVTIATHHIVRYYATREYSDPTPQSPGDTREWHERDDRTTLVLINKEKQIVAASIDEVAEVLGSPTPVGDILR